MAEKTVQTDNTTLWVLIIYIFSIVGAVVALLYEETKNNKLLKYHAKQSLGIFIVWIILYVLVYNVLWGIFWSNPSMYGIWGTIAMIPGAVTLILSILGILNGMNKKEVPVPIIGPIAEKISI